MTWPTNSAAPVLDYLINERCESAGFAGAISATNATAEVAKALEIQRDDVLLQIYLAVI